MDVTPSAKDWELLWTRKRKDIIERESKARMPLLDIEEYEVKAYRVAVVRDEIASIGKNRHPQWKDYPIFARVILSAFFSLTMVYNEGPWTNAAARWNRIAWSERENEERVVIVPDVATDTRKCARDLGVTGPY
ncbi:hypothetical protein EDD18DRAFT_1108821 [Armillaria luteobubalina]|uniref:Uncharacterized protein n=1 Tax=Armillaria luteobubalina TaxID=153913 RepID=A0AA39Q0B5_9AGAR|nr:hypothetical protein EDD18DRAFT_1108821 [Armillaria luteobubalina]